MSNRLMNAIMGNTQWNLQELRWWFGPLHNTRTPTHSHLHCERVEEGESKTQSDAFFTCGYFTWHVRW